MKMEQGGKIEKGDLMTNTLGRSDIRRVLGIMNELKDTEIVKTPEGAKAWEDLQEAMREGRPDTKKVDDALKVLRPKSPDEEKASE